MGLKWRWTHAAIQFAAHSRQHGGECYGYAPKNVVFLKKRPLPLLPQLRRHWKLYLVRSSRAFLDFSSPAQKKKNFGRLFCFNHHLFTIKTKGTMHRLSTTSSRSLRRAAAKAINKVSAPSLIRGAHKEIKFSNEGRASILKGVDILANAVSVTLGPKGKVSRAVIWYCCSSKSDV